MACNTCYTKFNFFHKELGCANCGLSFCSKCLKQKCIIPSKGSSEVNVCRICFNKLIKANEPVQSSFDLPDLFLKRLENLENPSVPPITVYKQNPKFQKLRTGLTPADQSLVDRLEKLKENKSKIEPPTETELRERLAHLKGNLFVETSQKCLIPSVDNRSNQEKVDGLLEQFSSEVGIELDNNPQEEIESRLAILRDKGVQTNDGLISNLETDDSEEEIEKISRRVMEEIALEDKSTKILKTDTANTEAEDGTAGISSDADVLPWCVLCNDDARFKCLDCEGDLYCDKCNREVHKGRDRDHHVVPFVQK